MFDLKPCLETKTLQCNAFEKAKTPIFEQDDP